MASKVVLKSTTKLSLNDRFSAYRKNVVIGATGNIRQRIQQIQQASARNRRLAIQMENRPSVIAALKLKKKSLKQRLGSTNIQQFRILRGAGNRPRGINRVRGIFTRRGNHDMGIMRRGFGPRRENVGNALRRGVSVGVGVGVGVGGGGGRRAMRRGRGMRNGRGRGGSPSGMVQFRTGGGQINTRGGFVGRGRGRGRGRGGRGGQKVPTKQELDVELEKYMANSKSQLDSELDAYMADAS